MHTYACLQNAMAAPLIFVIAAGSGEMAKLPTLVFPPVGVITLVVSCFAGLAMNYFSWRLRELLSATSVTVVGKSSSNIQRRLFEV